MITQKALKLKPKEGYIYKNRANAYKMIGLKNTQMLIMQKRKAWEFLIKEFNCNAM